MNATSLRHILSFLLLLLLTGCGTPAERQVRQTLRYAEEVLAEHPDSALTLLTPLDTMPLAGEEQAWYAVLRTQADYKLYHPVTDSLPLLATAYYGTPRRPHYRAAMAWYSLGCVYTEHNDDPRAIDAYLKARDLFPDTLCRYYALTEQNLGKHHLANHDYSKAVATFARYRNHPNCCSDSALIGFADFFLGKARMMKNEFSAADSLFHSVLANPHADAEVQRQTLFHLAKIYHAQGDNVSALFFLEAHRRTLPKDINQSAEDYLKGDILFDACSYDSAYIYYRRSLACSTDLTARCLVYNKLAKLAPTYEPDSLASYIDHNAALVGTINANARTTEIEQIQIDHQTDLKLQQAEYEKRRFCILTVSIALLIVSAIIILLMQRAAKEHKSYIRFQKEMAELKRQDIENAVMDDYEINDDILIKQQVKAEQNHSRKTKIDLCIRMFRQSSWLRTLNEHAFYSPDEPKMRLDERKKFYDYVMELMSDIAIDIIHDNPLLNQSDVFMCCLLLLGVSIRQMNYSTDSSDRALYSRRRRVRGKLTKEWLDLIFLEDSDKD